MAYAFNGSSQSLTMAAPAGIGFNEPLTMACWFYTLSGSTAQTLISIGPPDNENLGYWIRTGTTAKVLASKNNNTAPVTTLSLTTSAWNHTAAVFVSSASRTVYLNNTSVFSSSTVANATGTAFTSMSIGRRHVVGTTPQYLSGRIAEAGIWTAALTAEEILSLSQGASPALVRPGSLVFYAPLIRDLQDLRGGLAIANNNGATVVDHPRIYY
jgi:hypothetical protein